jgi:hypothetical protein
MNSKQETNAIRHIAINNGYPIKLIDQLQHKNLINNDKTTRDKQPVQNNKKWVTFKYHSPLARKITNVFKNTDLQITYLATNTLWQILNINKKHMNKYSASGIYSLKCSTCNHIYVGQTGSDVKTRFKARHRYIRINNPKSTYAIHIPIITVNTAPLKTPYN